MNKVMLKGRLAADPEIRYSQGEEAIAVASFAVAVSRGYKKENKEVTDFINCGAFRKTAEFMSKYFKKGQEILVEGRLHIDNYESKGEKKKSIYVSVISVEFCGSKDISGVVNSVNGGTNRDYKEEDVDDGDLPF